MDNECVYFYCVTGDSGQVAIELNRMLSIKKDAVR